MSREVGRKFRKRPSNTSRDKPSGATYGLNFGNFREEQPAFRAKIRMSDAREGIALSRASLHFTAPFFDTDAAATCAEAAACWHVCCCSVVADAVSCPRAVPPQLPGVTFAGPGSTLANANR